MKKVLFVASVVKTHIMSFHIPYLRWFKEQGYEVYVAARNDYPNPSDCNIPYCDHFVDLDFHRNPFSPANGKVYKQLKKLMDDNCFDIVHCHTPVAGVLSRKAARASRKLGLTKVIYTAHGFHFFKGAPWMYWILFYPIEKHYAHDTDTIIVMNREDYDNAKGFACKDIRLVNGVGTDIEKLRNTKVSRDTVRDNLGIKPNEFFLLSVGELTSGKNHQVIIKALKKMGNPTIRYFIAGEGKERGSLETLIQELDMAKQVQLLGYRRDVIQLYKSADGFAFPSKKEGLPVSVMEAMTCGVPIIASDIRGNRDLIVNEQGGFLVQQDVDQYMNAINRLIHEPQLRQKFLDFNRTRVDQYDYSIVMKQMINIYEQYTKR